MIRPALLVGALVALPTFASAQGIALTGDVTIGYQFSSIGGIPGLDADLNGYSIDFDGDLELSPEFSVGLGFGFDTRNLEVNGLTDSVNIDLISLSVEPTYHHESGFYGGLYYRMGDLDVALIGPITIGADTSQYGIFGGYDFGNGHVEAFYGVSQIEENSLIPIGGLDIDVVDYGISGSYQVMPELDIFGSVLRTNIDAGGTSIPITAYAIGAEYGFGNGLEVYGSFGGSVIDLSDLGAPDDVTAMGLTIGASYDLAQAGSSVPVILSAEYSRTVVDLAPFTTDDLEIDRFALGLTIPIGNGSGDALNSNTRVARGEYRSAIAAVVGSF